MNRIAIYEMPKPQSCRVCKISRIVNYGYPWGTGRLCADNGKAVTDYTDSRHPDCPLKIIDGKTCQRCGTISAVRTYGICHECNRGIENYNCKKEDEE